jgi:hypothetical protein
MRRVPELPTPPRDELWIAKRRTSHVSVRPAIRMTVTIRVRSARSDGPPKRAGERQTPAPDSEVAGAREIAALRDNIAALREELRRSASRSGCRGRSGGGTMPMWMPPYEPNRRRCWSAVPDHPCGRVVGLQEFLIVASGNVPEGGFKIVTGRAATSGPLG